MAVAANTQGLFEIKGIIADTSGRPLPNATVKLFFAKDSNITTTDKAGVFLFSGVGVDSFTIIASYSGLQSFFETYTRRVNSPIFTIPPITLSSSYGMMEGIVIRTTIPMLVKEDTVQFNASAYKVREGAPVEDVIKKLPGVTVDKDGNIETQGKKINRVRVNGKDFFGGDVQTATQNLPADVIDNIQIIDDYGDQANISGNKNGEAEKIININIQKSKNRGTFGNITAAAGNEGRYGGSLFANNFYDERQISFLGAVNNTNISLFNFNGGGRGGGGRGANLGSADRSGSGGAGITLTRSAGFNFRNKWGTRLSVYGSYSYSSRNNQVESSTYLEDLSRPGVSTQRLSSNHSSGFNHRLTWNMEYALDSNNYFKISPYFSYGSSKGINWTVSDINSISSTTGEKYKRWTNMNSASESFSPNGGGNLLYNHKFNRRARNFSVNFSLDFSKNDAGRFNDNIYRNFDSLLHQTDSLQKQSIGTQTKNTRTHVRFAYSEPLNQNNTTFLELSYDWNKSSTESLKEVYDFDSTGNTSDFNDYQSNHYNYNFITNKLGLAIRGRKEKYNYSVGIQSQPTSLKGYAVGKDFTTSYDNINWIPSARFVYNFAKNNSLTATIDGAAREPGFQQLQPVTDSSNLNNIIVGNASLKNEFTNTFALRYNRFDNQTGNSFFVNLSHDRTNDKIVSSRFYDNTNTRRTTTYMNTDGFYGYNGSSSFTKPFDNRKYTVGINMNTSYDNNISFTNGYRNKGSNWNLRPGVNFRWDLKDKVDLTVRSDYTIYKATARDSVKSTTTEAKTLNLGINGKNYFKDFTIGYDFSRVINYGFSKVVANNPMILNVYAEYRFLRGKMMTVKLQGLDLFDQNTGITRTVSESNVTDSRVNRLGRYFLLSVNWRLTKFNGATPVKATRMEGGQGNGAKRNNSNH